MANSTIEIDGRKITHCLTVSVRVKYGTQAQWRVWLGAHLLQIVKAVWNCEIEINNATQ